MPTDLVRSFTRAIESTDSLAEPALLMARLDYPRLDPAPYLERLDQMGADARRLVDRVAGRSLPTRARAALEALNSYLFDEFGLSGNEDAYDDPRNSFLNEVLDRRLGIPITLGIVYIEVARRAGVRIDGINFPGRFLLLCPVDPAVSGDPARLILDPFNRGALLNERDCRNLLHDELGDQVPFHPALLTPATRQQILVRMLLNLKRAYVTMRSFPQARIVTDLLMAASPSALDELRDRGLLAYHLKDFPAALRDLETYLRLSKADDSEESREERGKIWEHIKALRRRVAGMN